MSTSQIHFLFRPRFDAAQALRRRTNRPPAGQCHSSATVPTLSGLCLRHSELHLLLRASVRSSKAVKIRCTQTMLSLEMLKSNSVFDIECSSLCSYRRVVVFVRTTRFIQPNPRYAVLIGVHFVIEFELFNVLLSLSGLMAPMPVITD